MFSRFWERIKRIAIVLTEPSDSLRDPLVIRRARLAAAASALGVLFVLMWVLIAVANGSPVWLPTSLSLLALALLLAYIFSRSVNYRSGIGWLVGSLFIWGLVYPLFDLRLAPVSLLLLVGAALILAGALLRLRTAIWLSLGVVLYALLLPPSTSLERRVAFTLGGGVAFVGIIAAVIASAQRQLEEVQTVELVDLRENLEKRVEEHTAEIREAVAVGQVIAAAGSLDEIGRLVSRLIPTRLGFYASRLFLLDESGRYLVEQVAREEGAGSAEKGLRVAVGSSSIIGWAAQNKLSRTASQTSEDALQVERALVDGAQSQVVIPLLVREVLVGVLDVQSEKADAFDDWSAVSILQILANQIAVAVQNARRFQTAQFGVEDVSELYRGSYQVTQAESEADVVSAIRRVFARSPYVSLYLVAEANELRLGVGFDPLAQDEIALPERVAVAVRDLEDYVASGWFVGDGPRLQALPYELVRLLRRLDIFSAALVPVRQQEEIVAIILVGTRETRPLSDSSVQPYLTLSNLVADTLTRIEKERQMRRRMAEMKVLTRATQEFALLPDSETMYRKFHEYVQEALGQVNFQIVLYHQETSTLSIPYLFDKEREGQVERVEAFPLGEGLTSVVVRTRQPLLLADRVNERAEALGVRIVNEKPVEAWELALLSHVSPTFVAQLASRAPRTWLGVPLVAGETVLGAVVVQDVEREHAFNEDDLEFLRTLATQAGNALHNLHLIEETRRRAVQLQTAAEIAREISLSLDVNEVLSKAVNLIRERFAFYHAAVFLLDAANEYAVIREATGEAGQQMKRSGHRLKIGSTSIVGYVTGSGEPLIVNDTSRDATYYPNPLLPETRAEAALPLKVGARILGALDVQSTQPYAFTEDAMAVLRILADQLAIAVLNSELFAETQEHLSQHRLLHHVTTAAASGTTMEEALVGAAQGLQVTLGGDRVTILLADPEKRVLRVRAYAGYSEEISRLEVPFGQGITGWVAEHQQLLRVNDVTQDPRYLRVSSDVRSELAIPLVYRGELLGVLNVESEQLGAYDESDEEMLGTLAGSLAAIIANARLLDQVRRQVERERLIYELTTRIRRATNMQGVMATTVSELSKVLGARRARIRVGVGEGESPGANGEDASVSGGPS